MAALQDVSRAFTQALPKPSATRETLCEDLAAHAADDAARAAEAAAAAVEGTAPIANRLRRHHADKGRWDSDLGIWAHWQHGAIATAWRQSCAWWGMTPGIVGG